MTAGGTAALLGNSNQEEAVCGASSDLPTAPIDSDLAVRLTLQFDLPGQAAEGNKCRTTFGEVPFAVCRQVALVRVRGDGAG